MTMTGNEDLERKDDHLPKAAALCLVETGIEVDTNDEGDIAVDLYPDQPDAAFRLLSPFQARLLSDALLEAIPLCQDDSRQKRREQLQAELAKLDAEERAARKRP